MPIDITGNAARFEAGDTKQFTIAMTPSVPSTLQFVVFNTDGKTLALDAVQPSETVQASGNGAFYFIRVLPQSVGYYNYQWIAWDSNSKPYIERGEFEIMRTEAFSFSTYADVPDVVRAGRQLFHRADITRREIQPYCQAADGYIDSFLGMVTTVPLGIPPANLIRDMSKVYALWMFYSDRYSVEKESAPPAIVDRKTTYDELLLRLAAGSATIAGLTLQTADTVFTIPDGTKKPVFDMRDFTDQNVSFNLLEAERTQDEGD